MPCKDPSFLRDDIQVVLLVYIFLLYRDVYLTIRHVALTGFGSIAHEAKPNNLIVLVQLLLKFTSNNGFQLFLDVLLNFTPEKGRSD